MSEEEVQPPAPRESQAPPLPPWGWRECLAAALTVLGAFIVLGIILSIVVIASGMKTDSVTALLLGLVLSLVLECAMFAVAFSYGPLRFGGGLPLLGYRWRPPATWTPWVSYGVALAYVALFAYIALTQIPGLHQLQPQSNVPSGIFDHPATVPLAVALTVVGAPIAEETFFRGFLFNGLRRRIGFSNAAAVSGLLFSLAHTQGTLIIPFTVIGVILAWTYYRAGTLWANIGAHCLFNLVSVLLTFSGH